MGEKQTNVNLRLHGYAPGNYSCSCYLCKTVFMGDKRATTCKPCAEVLLKCTPLASKEEAMTIPERIMGIAKAAYLECEQMDSDGIIETTARAIQAAEERGAARERERIQSEFTKRNIARFPAIISALHASELPTLTDPKGDGHE